MTIVKEFYKLEKNKPNIGLLMMVKNEEKRIHVSLESVLGVVEALIIYDTGSIDSTISIISNFAEKHKINLYLKKGEFVDYSTSRNVSLDFADTVDVRYLLLLDCNDELQGGDNLKQLAKEYYTKDNDAFLVFQKWYSGKIDTYYNTRFIKNNSKWRYKGVVHEWMKDFKNTKSEDPIFPVVRLPDTVVLYQDRTKDDDKSRKRFTRDRELLLKEYKNNPTDPRTVFYLAQTCECLGNIDEALYYSKIRLELDGFFEERFHSYMRCARCCFLLGHPWMTVITYYLRCHEEQLRAEPFVKIAEYYKILAEQKTKQGGDPYNYWKCAFHYIREACEIPFPEHCILFMEKEIYDYQRWHLLGIIGFYAKRYTEGKQGCLRAIATGVNVDLDTKNLKFYESIEEPVIVDKKTFTETKLEELRKKFPNAKEKELLAKVKLLSSKK